jgi:hypothetical protein
MTDKHVGRSVYECSSVKNKLRHDFPVHLLHAQRARLLPTVITIVSNCLIVMCCSCYDNCLVAIVACSYFAVVVVTSSLVFKQ